MDKLISILLIEDNHDLREMLTDTLEMLGPFTVFAFENAEKGLEAFNQNNFQIIITDYHLNDMNGLQLIEKIALITQRRKLDYFLMTGDPASSLCKSTIDRLNINLIQKPFSIRDLGRHFKPMNKFYALP